MVGEDGHIFRFKTHAFRHTKAVELINDYRMPLEFVRDWLGHASETMTRVYAKILSETCGRSSPSGRPLRALCALTCMAGRDNASISTAPRLSRISGSPFWSWPASARISMRDASRSPTASNQPNSSANTPRSRAGPALQR